MLITHEQLKEINMVQVGILSEVALVCSKLGIKYYIVHGSLLGTIRNNRFVPDDDDIDIAIYRKDYVRFLNEAYKYLPQDYYLQTPYTDKKTPYSYSKLRLKNTKYIEYGYHRLNIEQGVYVDIYPIDTLPDDRADFLKQYKKFQRVAKLYAWRQCPYLFDQRKTIKIYIKKIIKFCFSYFLKLFPQKIFVNKLDKIATMYNGTDNSLYGNMHYPKPVNYFKNIVPFENGMFNGFNIKLPGGWEEHLKSRYGNYMELPPAEKRIGHKPYILEL